jgi:LysM repeat protein
MYQSISLIKLWAILVSVVIMLLQGCGTTPTEQSYDTDDTEFYSQDYNNEEVNYHTVQRGETLSIIANIYGIDYKTLAALNNIYSPYTIYPDQRIEIGSSGYRSGEYDSEGIPVSIQPLPRSQVLDYKRSSPRMKYSSRRKKSSFRKNRNQGNYYKVRKNNDFNNQRNYYRVKRGDNLYQIAQHYGKNYRQLAAWNFISPPYQLEVGQRLRLTPSQGSQHSYSSPSPVKKYSAPVKKGSVSSHIVQRGDTLSSIAKRYGYALWEIAQWNGLERPYYLSRGRRLRVAPWTTKSRSRTSRTSRTSRSRQQTTQSYGDTQSYAAKSSSRVYHTVVKGDTLYSLSKRYRSSISKIIEWNNLSSPYNLSVGQRLQVNPLKKWKKKKKRGASETKRTTRRHNTGYHTVARGETLFSISRNYGYSVSKIAGWNNLSPSYYLSVGQKLRVYPPSKVRLGRRKTTLTTGQRNTPAGNNVNSHKKVNSHIVAPGETLYSIAKRYGKTVSQLIRWNHLSSYTLLVGQRLQFYQTKNLQRTGRSRSYKKPKKRSSRSYKKPKKRSSRSYKKRSSRSYKKPKKRSSRSYKKRSSRSYKKRSSRRYYLVKRGDILKDVAARYGVSVYNLSNWNGIGAPYTLYPGQKLLIAPP